MKWFSATALLLLLSASLPSPRLVEAQTEGRSTKGAFEISLGDGHSRAIQFDARIGSDGSTSGQITFRDDAPDTGTKLGENSESDDAGNPFYAKAECDCLIVEGVEAVMGGVIRESSRKSLIGQRVLLVVQDGDSLAPPLRDKLTFGFYRSPGKPWVATDGERDNEGQPPTWVATDSEQPNDVGTISQKSSEVKCGTFPLSSHSFMGASQGKGKIEVTR